MRKYVVLFFLFTLSFKAFSAGGGDIGSGGIQTDIRQEAVLRSKKISSLLSKLKKKNNLNCSVITEEDGALSISFYYENDLSKYRAAFLCNDGRVVIFNGVISDGGKTTVESYKLELGPS